MDGFGSYNERCLNLETLLAITALVREGWASAGYWRHIIYFIIFKQVAPSAHVIHYILTKWGYVGSFGKACAFSIARVWKVCWLPQTVGVKMDTHPVDLLEQWWWRSRFHLLMKGFAQISWSNCQQHIAIMIIVSAKTIMYFMSRCCGILSISMMRSKLLLNPFNRNRGYL